MFDMFDIQLVDIYNLSTLCMPASVYTSEHSMTTLGLNVTVVFVSKTPFPLAPTTAMLPLLPRRWSLINILLNIYSLCMLSSVFTSEHSMTTLGLNVELPFGIGKANFPLAPTTAMLPLLPLVTEQH